MPVIRLALWCALLGLLPAAASSQLSPADRQKYVLNAVKAIRSTQRQFLVNLDHFVTAVERTTCRSDDLGMALACLLEQVEHNCKSVEEKYKSRCHVIADLVVVNKLNEKQFATRAERVTLMKEATENTYQGQIEKLLMRKYALLTTEMIFNSNDTCMDADRACLAKVIDEYCHQNADIKNIPWQACVSAIVWFMGTSK